VSSTPALAALGGDVSSVQTDRTRFKASVQFSPAAHYSVHELTAPTGTVIREYMTEDGHVFGVTWQDLGGPTCASSSDPTSLTSSRLQSQAYGAQWAAELRSSRLVIEMSGHPRAFGAGLCSRSGPGRRSEDEIQ